MRQHLRLTGSILGLMVALAVTAGRAPLAGAATDQAVYVADGAASAVKVFSTSASGNATPTNSLASSGPPASIAFDAGGNLWVGSGAGSGWAGNPGANTPGMIQEYTPAALATPGTPPAVSITTSFSSVTAGMAFDASGNMWIVDGGGTVDEFTAAQLASSGTKSPAVQISGIDEPNGVAFDSAGNMWVSSFADSTLLRYTAAQRQASGSPTPGVVISGSGLGEPARLRFDPAGNLWVANFGANTVVEYGAAQLGSSGSPTPTVTISSSGQSLDRPNGLDFDASGDLWVANVGASVVEFSHAQLGTTGAPAPVDEITGSNTGLQTPFMLIVAAVPSTTTSSTTTAAQTGVSLGCDYWFDIERDTCTVLAEGGQTVPTGNVHITADGPGSPSNFDCALTAASDGANISQCAFQFTPGTTATTLTAAYAGDSTHGPGTATFTICNDPATGLASCAPDPSAVHVCYGLYVNSCQGILPPPQPLQVCVSLYMNCNGFGGTATSPGTIDLSGFPDSVTTPVQCAQSATNTLQSHAVPHAPLTHLSNNPNLDCQIHAQFQDTSSSPTLADAQTQWEVNYETFKTEVATDYAALSRGLLNECSRQQQHDPTDMTSCRVARGIALLVNHVISLLYDNFAKAGVPITWEPPLFTDIPRACETFGFDPNDQACNQDLSAINQATAADGASLKARKHALGVDVPMPTSSGQTQHARRVAAGAAAKKSRFHPTIRALASGRLALRKGHKGKLKLTFGRQMIKALRTDRRHGIKHVRVQLLITIEDQVTRPRTIRLPLTLWLVHPPHHRTKKKHGK